MKNFEIGALYKIKEKIDWQIKSGRYQNGKHQLLFPSVAITSHIDDIVLILEEIKDDDHNEIVLYGDFTYKVLTHDNKVVYMYAFVKNHQLEKII